MNKTFKREQRLRKTSEFQKLYRYGKYAERCGLRVYTLLNPNVFSKRIGVVVPKRCGKAFQRNHVKRYVREWFRHQQENIPLGMDLVVQVKSSIWVSAAYGELFKTLTGVIEAAITLKTSDKA